MAENINDNSRVPVDIHQDIFAPILLTSPPVAITIEQINAIRLVLGLTSSDTDFAIKAEEALRIILSGGINGGIVPILTSLVPSTAVIGPAPVKVRTLGSRFDLNARILVNGAVVNTTYVSANELFTNLIINAPTGVKQFSVLNPSGAISNSLPFTVT